MTKLSTSEAIGSLAANIGENIYMDVAKWHLYLSDAHLDTVLAEKLYPLMSEKSIQEEQVLEVLRGIPVKLGGGKREVPLIELLPMQCQVNLIDLVEEFQRNL
ncbi:MAG: DUF3181 family protein [Phormidesmis sp. CAN_BIN36]|nr:DUF3181 family protein [Phormidesmis sp. CAN_BIN36]